ncbi:hypothetical protein LTR08_002308 [Meristemomyces frigidus]|nr:hypothetical protein LTR08_002308 [Meristemomyces frigidus]
MAPRKIIIDTDPGVDDILALLLACAALPSELEVLLISVTYGNIDVQNCLRNVISLFAHVEREIAWRKAQGREPGFATLQTCRPLVAVGPEHPLSDDMLMADFFHGRDGLGDIHDSHPHLSPTDTWAALSAAAAQSADPEQTAIADELVKPDALFTISQNPAHQEILRLLRDNEPDTITIVAIGPLTTLALAAAEDTEAFLRVKEVVVMGGTIFEPGNVRLPPPPPPPQQHHPHPHPQQAANTPEPRFRLIKQPPSTLRSSLNTRNQITPVAEFNTFADTVAAARLYALTSPDPSSTMPPHPPTPTDNPSSAAHPPPYLAPYPPHLTRQLKLLLCPLDITSRHVLTRGQYRAAVTPLLAQGSPLAEWTTAFLTATFAKVELLQTNVSGDAVGLALHDPLCVWYCLTSTPTSTSTTTPSSDSKWTISPDEDIRVETSGQWTRGMCIVDRRSRRRREDDDGGEVAGDTGGWLRGGSGNRVARCVGTPGEGVFGAYLLGRIFGV